MSPHSLLSLRLDVLLFLNGRIKMLRTVLIYLRVFQAVPAGVESSFTERPWLSGNAEPPFGTSGGGAGTVMGMHSVQNGASFLLSFEKHGNLLSEHLSLVSELLGLWQPFCFCISAVMYRKLSRLSCCV
ncbi:hypothetical protein V5799_024324 [Amblyomma americanum]|uniref:Uncharacterized protein n=1 Tax=Amblyomma americanum TaxID=6943 RepID=A0AAQ4ECM5_AMBAM